MTPWLGDSTDDVSQALRLGLDQAARRTGDEIARRRIWTRIADPAFKPARRGRWWLILGMGWVLAGAAAGVLLWPARGRDVAPQAQAPMAVSSVPPSAIEPGEDLPAAPDMRPRVVGPALVRTAAREQKRVVLVGGAEVELEGNSELGVDADNRPSVEKGRVSLEVPKQAPGRRFTVAAGPYVISVVGTKFHVRVAGGSVGVDVDEGVVEVWHGDRHVRLGAGDAWTSPSGPHHYAAAGRVPEVKKAPTVAAAQPPSTAPATLSSSWSAAGGPSPSLAVAPASAPVPARVSDPFREAQAAIGAGQAYRALEILSGLARGQGPTAENAVYEVGRVLRDHLRRPRDAIKVWQRYRERFPRGLLRAETDVSIVETMVSLGDEGAALAEADAFVQRYPDSERRTEVRRIAERLRSGGRGGSADLKPRVP